MGEGKQRLARALGLGALLARLAAALGMVAALGRVTWLFWVDVARERRVDIRLTLVAGILWAFGWALAARLLEWVARRVRPR